MIFDQARQVADAVLYEGYVLYPYRASARKNHVRWQFGVVAPREWSEAGGCEHWWMQTECLIEPDGEQGRLVGKVRFLQVQRRTVEEATAETFRPVESLDVEGRLQMTWDEAVEREVDFAERIDGADLDGAERVVSFAFPGQRHVEPISTAAGRVAGRFVRHCAPVTGRLRITVEPPRQASLPLKLRVRIENVTAWHRPEAARDDVIGSAFLGVHTLLAVQGGSFVSLLDPPEWAAALVAACVNIRTWPVMMGNDGERRIILSSPIILYDYPRIAPESPGDLYDATEIDEILTLRTLTLTDEEKREARATDARAAAIIDRVDAMPPEVFDRLHGALRSPAMHATGSVAPETPPWWDPGADASVCPATDRVEIRGVKVSKGHRVRLCPGARRADAQDMFLAGRIATVEGVFFDVENHSYLAVTLEQDPAAELYQWHGRYLYFSPDEVEPLEAGDMSANILVAGVGNLFLGDDGFGGAVARQLAADGVPDGVRVEDFGIRGVHLAFELLNGYDTLILVDAVSRGGAPGTIYVIEPELDEDEGAPSTDAHGLDPVAVLRMARTLGGWDGEVVVVGCEAAEIVERIGLSAQLEHAVAAALRTVRALIVERSSTAEGRCVMNPLEKEA